MSLKNAVKKSSMIGSAPTLAPSDLVAVINQNFEYALGQVTLEGELSEFKVRKEKWLYFKVKDDEATIDCFGTVFMMPGPLEDGMMVRVTGSPKLHPKFGFSFQVRSVTVAGEGSIKKASELLRLKLEAEGLFNDDRKRFVPYPPQTIALITSKEGAAVGDFTKVLQARWPFVDTTVYGATVQGDAAPDSIVAQISEINKLTDLPDVIVITRGGGSAEDLMAFSDERVVRAVASSRVPTVVAIGHEQDMSLAERAADLRASTPSNAAELLVPSIASEREFVRTAKTTVDTVLARFEEKLQADISHHKLRYKNVINRLVADHESKHTFYRRELELLNPKNVLARGYAVVRSGGKAVTSAVQLKQNDRVEIMLSDGTRESVIQ